MRFGAFFALQLSFWRELKTQKERLPVFLFASVIKMDGGMSLLSPYLG
jgi:hypothetical protein